MGVYWKIPFLGGVTKNQYIRGNCLKGGVCGQFAGLRGGMWQKRGDGGNEDYGWVRSAEILEQEKTVWNAVPEAIVELVHWKCKKGCKTNDCGCKKTGFTCTDACICNKVQERKNQKDYYCYNGSDNEEK